MSELISTQKLSALIAEFLPCKIDIANLYLSIMNEPKTKEELVGSSGIPLKQLDADLNALSSFCLISDYSGRDKNQIFFVIDPQFSFPAIILADMWAVDANLHTISDLTIRTDLVELNKRNMQCQVIIKNLKGLYKKQLPFLKEMAVVINGYKRTASCISELLETAKTDIFAVVSPPHLLGEIIWHTVVEKMKDGVAYQRITTFDELVRHGYEIFKNEIQNYNETLYICKNNVLSHKFYVINNITVVFFIPDTQNKDFKFEVQIINNAGWSKKYKDVYEKLKGESIKLTDLMSQITSFRTCFLNKAAGFLCEDECKWLKDVFDYGVFCKHQGYPLSIFNSAKLKCMRERVITVTDKDEILANYSLQEVLNYAI